MEKINLTSKEFQARYITSHATLLIERDSPAEMYGSIALPTATRDRMKVGASTGIIIQKSQQLPKDWFDAYLLETFKEGDRVCFSNNHPIAAPAPQWFNIGTSAEKDTTVYIHVYDISGYIVDNDSHKIAIEKRIEVVNNKWREVFHLQWGFPLLAEEKSNTD